MRRFPLLYIGLAGLYGAVGYLSPGYDDEFFNINLIEKLGSGVMAFAQTTDVHPPGSYLLNWLLYAGFGRWELVRLAISLLTASSLIWAVATYRKREGDLPGFLLFLFMGLNPAILLWCTGLRWYAFFVPVLIWLSIVPEQPGWKYWAKCFGGLLVLGYLGYAVFVVALPILLLYWKGSEEDVREKLRKVITLGLGSAILYAPQLFIFVTVHIKNMESQVSSMEKNLIGFAVAQISNQGVFPLSLPGALASIATLGIVVTLFFSNRRVNLGNRYFIAYALSSALMIVTGLAGKFRNLVVLSPWQALWMATARIEPAQKKSFKAFVLLLAIANFWGVFNVATHQDTTKNSWNLPVRHVMEVMAAKRTACHGDLVVLSHDPTLLWHLERAGYPLLGPYTPKSLPDSLLYSRHNCVVLLKTFAGSIAENQYQRMIDELRLLDYGPTESATYGRDSFYALKRKLDSRYPEYMVEMVTYHGASNLAELKSWRSTETLQK